MLKFSHPEDEKKETGQYKTQGMCIKAVEEEVLLCGLSLIILKNKKCVKKLLNKLHGC